MKLTEYLPDFFSETEEFKIIFSVIESELIQLYSELDNFKRNRFADTADEKGLKRLAEAVNSDKLYLQSDDLRFLLMLTIADKRPYTINMIEKLMNMICKNNGYELFTDVQNGIFRVRLNLGNKNKFSILHSFLDKIVPANMVLDIDCLYNPYSMYKTAEYMDLSAFTYDDLKSSPDMKEEFN